MSFEEKRLFHRYPSGLRVAFRIGGTGFRGKVINVSAAGGFVATKAPPAEGSRVQMAAQVDRPQPSVWLDLRVTWVVTEPREGIPMPGFGGFWLHASSRYGEEPLRGFLGDVLGITRPVLRPMTPPSGGSVVHVYRFPDIYDGQELADVPWWAQRHRHPPRRPALLASAPADTAEIKLPTSGARSLENQLQGFDDHAPVPAGLSQNTQVFFADVADEAEAPSLGRSSGSGGAAGGEESRWGNIVKKLSGFRSRGSGAGGRDDGRASGVRPLPGLPSLEYQVGRKAHPGELSRIGTGWIVFNTEAGAKPPEVWSRLVIVLKPPAGKKAEPVEVHATVTRTKEAGTGTVVHCKVNRIDERGHAGVYSAYVDAFNAKLPG